MDVREKFPSEKRLIDANAMRDDWLENGENKYVYDTNAVLDSIDSKPTVDAVEVVRCNDCIRRYDTDECPMCFLIEGKYYEYTNGNGFCDRGERKEGAE